MIPAAFEYFAPTSLGEATALLGKLGEDAKILSGGQSLIPMMKLPLTTPAQIVDINGSTRAALQKVVRQILRARSDR
jgi:aerobic carbon-monoxide dehydrogenase medium subunit